MHTFKNCGNSPSNYGGFMLIVFLDFLEKSWHLLEKNWYLVILGYYAIFTAGTFGTYTRTAIFEGGKLRLKEVAHWLAVAWTIPTVFVVVGLIGSLLGAGMSASGECHQSHGWECGATSVSFSVFFKGGVAWIQVIIIALASIGGTLFAVCWTLHIIYKKYFPLISRAGKAAWERFPVRW